MRFCALSIFFILFFAHLIPVFAQDGNNWDRATQLYKSGNEALAKSDFSLAIGQYSQAITLYPLVPEFYFNRAIAYRNTRRFDLAIKDFEKVIALDPKLPTPTWIELYLGLGTVYQENSEYAKSLEILDRVVTLDPTNARIYNNRGNTYLFLKRYDDALDDFNKSLDLEPTALAYYSRARIYVEMRNEAKAILDYTKAVEINPRFAEAFSNRGLLHQKRNSLDNAVGDFSKAIALDPLDGIYYSNRANIYVMQKRFSLAVADYTKAAEIFPRWAEPLRRRANAYLKLGKNKLAEADLRRVKEIEKDDFSPANKVELINP